MPYHPGEIVEVRRDYDENLRNRHDYRLSVCDLFRYRSLRCLTLSCLCFRFFINFQFTGTGLMLKQYATNIYINGMILGLS